jgi:hypothetical protein
MKSFTRLNRRLCAVTACGCIAITAIATTVADPAEQEASPPRAASLAEIRQLFDLATTPVPERSVIEADVERITPPYTQAQIDAELAHIKEFMRDAHTNMTAQDYAGWETVQSNAIVKGRSGVRVLHVREWYSGDYYRRDMNDEGMGREHFMQTHPNEYCDSQVEIPNSPFSEYSSYSVDRNLRSVMFFREARRWQRDDFASALTMNKDVAAIVIMSLAQLSGTNKMTPHAFNVGNLLMDPQKAQRLQDQSDSRWQLDATDEEVDGRKVTHFRLKGGLAPSPQLKSLTMPDVFQADLWMGQMAGKAVCLQERANLISHTSMVSKREQYDAAGFPTRWTIAKVRDGVTVETTRVTVKRMELHPTFTDEEVFAPDFPEDYIISDMSSGKGVTLQKPDPEVWLRGRTGSTNAQSR